MDFGIRMTVGRIRIRDGVVFKDVLLLGVEGLHPSINSETLGLCKTRFLIGCQACLGLELFPG